MFSPQKKLSQYQQAFIFIFFCGIFGLGLTVFQDYGISWDEPTQRNYGLANDIYPPRRFPDFDKKRGFSPLVMATLMLTLVINGKLYYNWASSPNYTAINASKEMGELLDNAYIAGLWAPLICLENKHKALYVGEGWFNDKDIFIKFPITHLFLWDGNNKEELRFLLEEYPNVMERAQLLKIYFIKDMPTRLFEIGKAK